jgi:hypothetical protein
MHLCVATDGQWFSPGWVPGFGDIDRSKGNLASFREWLARQYQNDVRALQSAWKDPKVTFANATLPEEAERSPSKYFLDPSADRRLIDTNRYLEAGRVESADGMAEAFKAGFGRPSWVTTYYHNKFWATGLFARQKHIDGTIAVEEYGNWREVGRTGSLDTVPGTLTLHGKSFLAELDYRTENATTWGSDAWQFRREIVTTLTPDEAANQLRRDLGNALAQGGGAWHYALTHNSWAAPEHMRYIEEARRVSERIARSPQANDRAQIAVFFDEDSPNFATQRELYGARLHHEGYRIPRVALDRSGLSWDNYTLADLDNPKLPNYKMYVFLTAGAITPQQIRFVQQKLQRDGRVLLFLHHAGYNIGSFDANIRALTGMRVRVDLDNRDSHRYLRTGQDRLNDGVENIISASIGPLFWVDDQAPPRSLR